MRKREKILFLGDKESPIITWLKAQGERVTQTTDKLTYGGILNKGYAFLISYGYRHIISQDVLSLFPNRAINLHISYLPYNRGADPNLWSFIEDTPKGVT